MSVKLKNPTVNMVATITLEKESAVTIKNWFVTLDSNGYCVQAADASTAIRYAPYDVDAGVTKVPVVADPDAEFIIESVWNYTKSYKGKTYDLKVSSWDCKINFGSTTTNVLKVSPSYRSGTNWSTKDVIVKIANGKSIY